MAHHLSSQRREARPGLQPLEGRLLLSQTPGLPVPHCAAEVALMCRGGAMTPNPSRWAWLANTYWYVPTPNLPATVFNPQTGTIVPVLDQTVYHITGYRSGYFWAETVTQIGQGTPTSSALVGSVTPQGRLLLSFTSTQNVVPGYGVMTRHGGGWTMENQMFTETSSGSQVGHWAYMVQTRPGMKSWRSLPSAGVSVPTFLSHYSGPTPAPVIGS